MAINLSEADHLELNALLDSLLTAHAEGDISQSDARAALAHVIAAAALGNEGEFRSWPKPETCQEWRRMLD
jgi:hypothetical protein